MKRRTLFLILFAIVVVSLAVPVFGFKDLPSYFDNVTSILGALGTVFAVFIAILLFDRFSIEGEVLSKQHDAVATLAQNLNISFMYASAHTFDATEFYTFNGAYEGLETYPQKLHNYSLRFSLSAYKRLSAITSGVQLMYLPDDVYSNCVNLLNPTPCGQSQTENVYFVVIRAFNPWNDIEFQKEELTSFDNLFLSTQTFGEFCHSLVALNQSIDAWFKNHGYRNPRLQMNLKPMKLSKSHYNTPSPKPDIVNDTDNSEEKSEWKRKRLFVRLNPDSELDQWWMSSKEHKDY